MMLRNGKVDAGPAMFVVTDLRSYRLKYSM